MSRGCTICDLAHCNVIDRRLISGHKVAALATAYGVSRQALYRHEQQHLRADQIAKRKPPVAKRPPPRVLPDPDAADDPDDDMDELEGVTSMAWLLAALRKAAGQVLAQARGKNDGRPRLLAMREMAKLAEASADRGEFKPPGGGDDNDGVRSVVVIPDNGREPNHDLLAIAERVRALSNASPAALAARAEAIAAEIVRLAQPFDFDDRARRG